MVAVSGDDTWVEVQHRTYAAIVIKTRICTKQRQIYTMAEHPIGEATGDYTGKRYSQWAQRWHKTYSVAGTILPLMLMDGHN